MQRILVIDDEPLFLEATIMSLQRRGFETIEANNGLEGEQLATRTLPDLIICDVNMERMDGYTLLEHLRQQPVTATIPFIFMTGMGDAESMRKGMNLGADDFLAKPCPAQQLFSTVDARHTKNKVLRENAEKKLTSLRTNLSLALPHEMITPLNGIFGLAQVLADCADTLSPEEVAEYGTNILQSAERLHRTVQNFILYGQLEMQAGDPEYIASAREKSTSDLHSITESRARHIADKANRSADLQCVTTDGTVAMSQDLFTKLVDELTDNAFKFSKPGSPVRIEGAAGRGEYLLSVSDQGAGMTPEQIAEIGAYSQFDRQSREQQGSGLGLAIVRRITELHAGQFDIKSEPGIGTTVILRLPA